MDSRQAVARYGPVASAALGVVGAVVPFAGVVGAVVGGVSAVAGLKNPTLEAVWENACRSLAEDLAHPRKEAGDEAEAVEAQVLGVINSLVRENRQELLLAALEGLDGFREALSGLDLTTFSDSGRHYADRMVERLGGLVRRFALSPAVYPELSQEQLRALDATVQKVSARLERLETSPGQVAGLREEQTLLEARVSDLQSALAALRRELGRVVEKGAMPRKAAHFVQRQDLDRVREAMAASDKETLCAVSGMRGVGKSQLAAAFARECINTGWDFVAWVSATSRAAVITQMAQIARRKELTREPDDEDAAEGLVSWLSGSSGPRLLVFDSVESADDLDRLVPEGAGMRVLVTTTARTDALGQRLDVGVFTPDEAVGYLTGAAGNPDRDGARAVAETLGYLPVALAQAAAMVGRRGYSYQEYLEILSSRALDKAVYRPGGDSYPAMVGKALYLAFRDAIKHIKKKRVRAAAVLILDAVALLAESGVPRSWLYTVSDSQDAGRDAVGALVEAGILALSEDRQAVSLHRLQSRVWRENVQAATNTGLLPVEPAVKVLSRVTLADDDAGWEEKQATAQALATQLIALHSQTCSGPLTHDPRVLATSVFAVKWCLEAGLAGLAVQLAPYTCLHEKVLGPNHPDTLTSRNNLAIAYQDAGRYAEAIPLFEETLTQREQVLGPNHPDTLASRNNLAIAYQDAGRYAEAIPLHEQTLTQSEQTLGPNHPNTLTSRNNLAGAYKDAGRYAEAIPLFEETLTQREQVLGPNHPDILASRNNLALAYQDAGRYAEAIPLHEQTLTQSEQTLGPNHPNTLTSRNNLFIAYAELEQWDKAVPVLEQIIRDGGTIPGIPGDVDPRELLKRLKVRASSESPDEPQDCVPDQDGHGRH